MVFWLKEEVKMRKVIITLFLISSINTSKNKALTQIKKLNKTLKSELQKKMKNSPAKTLEICQLKTPVIQNSLSNNKIKIRKVSLKNRNPKNTP